MLFQTKNGDATIAKNGVLATTLRPVINKTFNSAISGLFLCLTSFWVDVDADDLLVESLSAAK
jgi:hypothetical protein